MGKDFRRNVPKQVRKHIKKNDGRLNRLIDRFPVPRRCDVCGGKVKYEVLVREQFGRPVKARYVCKERGCGALVHTNRGTKLPMGKMGDSELRFLRREAHTAVGWNSLNDKQRTRLYEKIGKHFGIERRFHISLLSKEQCRELIKLAQEGIWQ